MICTSNMVLTDNHGNGVIHFLTAFEKGVGRVLRLCKKKPGTSTLIPCFRENQILLKKSEFVSRLLL